MPRSKNSVSKAAPKTAKEFDHKVPRKPRKRRPPVVPKGKSLAEIKATDPESPEFKHPKMGQPIKKARSDPKKSKDLPWKDVAKEDKQGRARKRRASVRRYEAEIVAVARQRGTPISAEPKRIEVMDKKLRKIGDEAVATHVLDLDEWDNEELARGYRRNRNGRWGAPPKMIPREIQQEAFRRLVKRGEQRFREEYMKIIEGLVSLAHEATSEKVRLDAQKELLDRLVGKVPEHLKIAPEAPWQDMLADSIIAFDEPIPVIEVESIDNSVYPSPDDGGSDGELD